jgi:hypothetical protein
LMQSVRSQISPLAALGRDDIQNFIRMTIFTYPLAPCGKFGSSE